MQSGYQRDPKMLRPLYVPSGCFATVVGRKHRNYVCWVKVSAAKLTVVHSVGGQVCCRQVISYGSRT